MQYTGPVSSPEYLNHLPRATNYRAISPACVPPPTTARRVAHACSLPALLLPPG